MSIPPVSFVAAVVGFGFLWQRVHSQQDLIKYSRHYHRLEPGELRDGPETHFSISQKPDCRAHRKDAHGEALGP
jgi:hypothetical protein